MSFKPAALISLVLLLTMGACASASADYPSLAIRDAERVSGTMAPPESIQAPPAPSAEALGQIDRLAATAGAAHQAFMAEVPNTRRVVASASGGGVGSENWARAQVALAGLESERSKAVIALADIDRLYVDAAVDGDELSRVASVRSRVTAQVDEQNAIVESLLGSLR